MATVIRQAIAPPSEVVNGWLKEWVETREELGRNARVVKLRYNYVTEFRTFLRRNHDVDLDCEDNTLVHEALKEFVQARVGLYRGRTSDATMQAKLQAIRAFFRWLIIEGILPSPWISFEGLIDSKAVSVVLPGRATVDEIINSLYAIDQSKIVGMRDFVMIALTGYANFNFNGVVHMTVGDVVVENDELSIPFYSAGSKVEVRRRVVKITPEFSAYLSSYIEALYLGDETDDSPLFPRMHRADWRDDRQALSEMMLYNCLTTHLQRQNLRQTIAAKDFVAEFERRFNEL